MKNRFILSLLFLLLFGTIPYSCNYFQRTRLKAENAKNANKIISLMFEASSLSDSTAMQAYSDSCVTFLKTCPENEKDSIKSAVYSFIVFWKKFETDMVTSIQKDAKLDTLTLFTPAILQEIQVMCNKCGEDYRNFKSQLCIAVVNTQENLERIKGMNNPEFTTTWFGNNLQTIYQRNDSINHVIFNRMFEGKN